MSFPASVRIGTRESALALYQAHAVQDQLLQKGIQSEIIEITSDGDIDLVTPLYELGIQGIFTKSLDIALLQNRIDIAVHSAKDIPTRVAKGLVLSSVLERHSPYDCFVLPKGKQEPDYSRNCIIATSSMRRKSQWLHRYPHHQVESLRGNIQKRLEKLDQSRWQGAIFAQAALDRLDIGTHQLVTLDWMLPAPAQGAIAMICREDDQRILDILSVLNHDHTKTCISAERDFLSLLQGGCAVPIAAHALIEKNQLLFKGNVFSLDAKEKCEVEISVSLDKARDAGRLAAEEILRKGGDKIIRTFRPSF